MAPDTPTPAGQGGMWAVGMQADRRTQGATGGLEGRGSGECGGAARR
jgi:hypothetical protein